MKRINLIFILIAAFLMVAAGTFATVHAGSYENGKYPAGSGQGVFQKHFSDMDINGDDSLDFEEFKNVFPSTEQKAFDRLDTDQNGSLSHDEWHQFKEMHSGMGKHHQKKLPEPSKFNAHFPDMDTDQNARVTLEEFKAYFSEKSDHEHVFNAIDIDGKGDIDHDEWHEFKSAHGLKHME